MLLWFLLACALVALVGFALWANSEAEADCNRRGGTYVHTGRYNTVCFKKGVVVE